MGGQYLAQRQAFRELLQVLAIASALVFVILAIPFRRSGPAVVLILGAVRAVARARCWHSSSPASESNVSSAMGGFVLPHRARRHEPYRPARLRGAEA